MQQQPHQSVPSSPPAAYAPSAGSGLRHTRYSGPAPLATISPLLFLMPPGNSRAAVRRVEMLTTAWFPTTPLNLSEERGEEGMEEV